ncbi:AAA family ATPase [Thermoflexus sp.]|jgi:predicted ATPase|uniref:AAA family ATPase n=1 Tax=Thermoflexus sp. TaxID=1969742 RepID=UPI003BFA9ED5
MSDRGWLRIEIENFGPIASGSFELRPLTLFIGPNNAGKSYAATLAHSIVRTIRSGVFFSRVLEEEMALLTIQELVDRLFSSEYLQEGMLGRLQNYFSSEDLSALISRFALEDRVRVRVYRREAEDGWIYLEGKGPRWSVKGKAPKLPNREGRRKTERISVGELWRAHRLITETMGLPDASYYLPAARSGVLQGWRALATEAVRRVSRWAGIEEIRVPALPGLIGEFLEELIHASEGLRRRSRVGEGASPFQSALEVLEEDLLKGAVDFSYPDGVLVPEIVYRTRAKRKKLEIPIRRASSTVGELTPLVLWIKYLLRPGGMLVIEEPEAHLHPENQRRVARALVRLVRAGVTVLCTTHSPLILHQVSNHILASRADPARRKELGFTEEDLLREEEVGAYLFRMREDGRGCGRTDAGARSNLSASSWASASRRTNSRGSSRRSVRKPIA